MADPTVKPAKPKLYKMVSLPKITGGATIKVGGQTIAGGGSSLTGIIKAMNSLGATTNSIAIITESIAKQTHQTIATEIRQQSELIRRQEKLRRAKKVETRKKEDKRKKDAQKQKDQESEKQSESGGKILGKFAKFVTNAAGGFLSGIAQLLGGIFRAFVVTAVLDWISKPGSTAKVGTIIKGIIGIFKVFQRILAFGMGSALEGIAKMIENPISFKGLFGAVQFIVGAAILMKGIRWLKNPATLAKDLVSVIGFIAKGILNLKKGVGIYGKIKKFTSTRAGKYAIAGAVGVGAGMGSALLGGTKEEAIGTGIGAGAGAIAGDVIGTKLGGEMGGQVGGAAGAALGGLMGGPIGKALKPVTDALGKFFGLIGDVLKPVFDFVMNIGKEFYSAVGDLIQAVVNIIEPHKETLSWIAKGTLTIAFLPLIMMMKAITSVIRFFIPKGSQDKGRSGTSKRAAGGPVVVPKMASGGALNAPSMVNPITQQLQQALSNAILLPFKAVGIGLVSAMGMIGNLFGAFLPGPMQMLLGGILAPIASMFGVPNSVFKKVSGFALKGVKNAGTAIVGVATGASDAISDLFDGGEQTVNGLLSKILDAVMKMGGNGTTPKAAIGGAIPQAANGGWINGPMSGYPVSLDGGRSTSFIGHGREWVGFKGHAAGGSSGSAFVIPFNTPATVRTPSLTSMRMGQARAGGYALPRSIGGVVPKFATGGKFDPEKFNKNMSSMSSGIPVGKDNQKITMRYAVDGDQIMLGHAIDQTNAGWDFLDLLGNDGKVQTINPSGDRFKQVVTSSNLMDYLSKDQNIKEKFGPKLGQKDKFGNYYIDSKKLAGHIKIHPDAQKFYDWTVRGKRLVGSGKTKQEAWKLAAEEVGVKTDAERKAETLSASNDQASVDEFQSADNALKEALKAWQEAFSPSTGDKLDKQSKATKSAQEKSQQDKTKAAASELGAAAASTSAKVNNAAPKQVSRGEIPLNSGGSERPSSDINPFLRSPFGVISQSNYAPQNIVV